MREKKKHFHSRFKTDPSNLFACCQHKSTPDAWGAGWNIPERHQLTAQGSAGANNSLFFSDTEQTLGTLSFNYTLAGMDRKVGIRCSHPHTPVSCEEGVRSCLVCFSNRHVFQSVLRNFGYLSWKPFPAAVTVLLWGIWAFQEERL